MKMSDKLITLRKERGWSQEDFAEKLDVSRQAISRWENGTALPDAQNILRISKLFNVTADYLLNDSNSGETDIAADETAAEETQPADQKKKRFNWHLTAGICVIVLALCAALLAVKSVRNAANDVHTHPALIRVVENEIAPSCTVQGSYDEVIYCAECGVEVLRTHISMGMPTHQFVNEKCIVCGEDQRER